MASRSQDPAGARPRAETRSHLAERRRSEADQAVTEVAAAKAAEAQKTARLKALRLAREQDERAAAAAAPPPAKAPTRRKARAAAKA